MTWQGIESAPKDGTEILAYDMATGASHVTWTDQWGHWHDPGDHYYSESPEFVPTHWTPFTPFVAGDDK